MASSLKADACAAGSLNGLALYLACAPPTPTEKLETALSPVDQIMPTWIVLVDCRACVHIWKSRQNKGNALMGEWLFLIALRHSTKLTSAAHVTATWRYGFAVSKFISKSLCCRKVLFCDVVRAHIRPRSRSIQGSEGVSLVGARQDQPHWNPLAPRRSLSRAFGKRGRGRGSMRW